uniref:Aha1_N domain-containing protein n=1 Tax=Trichuris muris TaxID=70415 RepID=A0A5S6QXQ6_TRIMR
MAKWGEGDPRWIVEERPDATNVNNWHWTERNATPWSKQRLTELLTGLEVSNEKASCCITSISKMEGEASANNRKAKLIFLYSCDGEVEIPNLSDENEIDAINILVTTKNFDEKASQVKSLMENDGEKLIRKQLGQYIRELKEEFGVKAILPTKNNPTVAGGVQLKSTANVKSDSNKQMKDTFRQHYVNDVNVAVSSGSSKTRQLSLKEKFRCSAMDAYMAFVSEHMIKLYTRSPCAVDSKPGGKFWLFDHMVDGAFLELEPGKKVLMNWRMKSWPENETSTVSLTFEQMDDGTELILEQTGVPEDHFDATEDGWRRHYFAAIKGTFGRCCTLERVRCLKLPRQHCNWPYGRDRLHNNNAEVAQQSTWPEASSSVSTRKVYGIVRTLMEAKHKVMVRKLSVPIKQALLMD